jgi:hypothetical protein
VPYQREAVVVLAAWREAERVLVTAEIGNLEYQDARAQASRCCVEYHRLILEAGRQDLPQPPRAPDDLLDLELARLESEVDQAPG